MRWLLVGAACIGAVAACASFGTETPLSAPVVVGPDAEVPDAGAEAATPPPLACGVAVPACKGSKVDRLDFADAAPKPGGELATSWVGGSDGCSGVIDVRGSKRPELASTFGCFVQPLPTPVAGMHFRVSQTVFVPAKPVNPTLLTFGCGVYISTVTDNQIEVRLEVTQAGDLEIDGVNDEDIGGGNPRGSKFKDETADSPNPRTIVFEVVITENSVNVFNAEVTDRDDHDADALVISYESSLKAAELRCGIPELGHRNTDIESDVGRTLATRVTISAIDLEICGN